MFLRGRLMAAWSSPWLPEDRHPGSFLRAKSLCKCPQGFLSSPGLSVSSLADIRGFPIDFHERSESFAMVPDGGPDGSQGCEDSLGFLKLCVGSKSSYGFSRVPRGDPAS